MKNMRTSAGKFGAASSKSGHPHTPASMGRKTQGLTGEGGTDCRVRVKASTGRDMGNSAAKAAKAGSKHGSA